MRPLAARTPNRTLLRWSVDEAVSVGVVTRHLWWEQRERSRPPLSGPVPRRRDRFVAQVEVVSQPGGPAGGTPSVMSTCAPEVRARSWRLWSTSAVRAGLSSSSKPVDQGQASAADMTDDDGSAPGAVDPRGPVGPMHQPDSQSRFDGHDHHLRVAWPAGRVAAAPGSTTASRTAALR
jgi:hypothetical protein